MNHPYTIKNWKKIRKDILNTNMKKWKPKVYMGRGMYISEISFIKRNKSSVHAFTYGCYQCSQALLNRIYDTLPEKIRLKCLTEYMEYDRLTNK